MRRMYDQFVYLYASIGNWQFWTLKREHTFDFVQI